jgi:cytoskeletal protein CcmA (bactofilin family)
MFLFSKIKASALQMVLVVSVIIVILLFAFISLMYFQKRVAIKHSNYTDSVYSNHQVFDYLKAADIPFGKTDSIALFLGKSTASITKKQWGVFELLIVETKKNKETFKQVALLGGNNPTKKALYLKNNDQQLILVGNTRIKGNVALPSLGVNSGNIGGVSYNKEKFIYGDRVQSEREIPAIINKKNISSFLSSYSKDSVVFFDVKEELFLRNSFTKKTQVHQINGAINLVNSKLIGNIIIESDTLIRVSATSVLQDVILIAPRVEISGGFKGNVQIFATKNIIIEKNSQLEYPSSLVLFNDQNNGGINLSKGSTVKGIISYFSNSEKSNYNAQILLDTKSVVFGEVYCQGNLELKGEVTGSVYTNSFIVHQSGGTYINHIFNGSIDSEKLPNQYAGLSFVKSSKSVAKWLK